MTYSGIGPDRTAAHVRSRNPILALPFVAACLLGLSATAADTPPLVVAVDVTLEPRERASASATVTELVGALPPDAEIGLVVFDDVVRDVVPLAAASADQLDAFDAALGADARDVRGNVAVGLERGLDELGERAGAHLMLFARAQVSGEDEESRERFAAWYRELLLPDAAARGIAVTLVAPPSGADATLLSDIGEHSGNAVVTLDADAGASLVTALRRRLAGAGIELAATTVEDDAIPATRELEASTAGDASVATAASPTADATDTAVPGAVAATGGAAIERTVDAPVDTSADASVSSPAPLDAAAETRRDADGGDSTLERLRPLLLAAAAVLAGLLLVATLRQRRAPTAAGTASPDEPTVRSVPPGDVATAARVRASPSIERARADVATREAAGANPTIERPLPTRARPRSAPTPDGRHDEQPTVRKDAPDGDRRDGDPPARPSSANDTWDGVRRGGDDDGGGGVDGGGRHDDGRHETRRRRTDMATPTPRRRSRIPP